MEVNILLVLVLCLFIGGLYLQTIKKLNYKSPSQTQNDRCVHDLYQELMSVATPISFNSCLCTSLLRHACMWDDMNSRW